MDKAKLAERLLVPMCGRGRAGEVVGDLLETSDGQMGAVFWHMWARVALALLWRRIDAFAAGIAGVVITICAFSRVTAPRMSMPGEELSPAMLLSILGLLPCALSWSATGVLAARLGPRSKGSIVAFAGSAVLTLSTFTLGLFRLRLLVLLVGVLLLAGLGARQRWRSGVASYLGAMGLSFASICAVGGTLGVVLAALLHHGMKMNSFGQGVPSRALNDSVAVLLFAPAVLLQTWVAVRGQKRRVVMSRV